MYMLLAEETAAKMPAWVSYVVMGVLIVLVFLSMFLLNRKSKKREQEAQKLIDAVKPGNKVKTIGGICGIVVEVNAEEDTFVLETGSETSGKCYMKFVRQAILESDAVLDNTSKEAATEAKEAPAEENSRPAGDPFTSEEPSKAPAEEPEAEAKKLSSDDKEDKE